jgi:hypothetical protein
MNTQEQTIRGKHVMIVKGDRDIHIDIRTNGKALFSAAMTYNRLYERLVVWSG